jgi:hypothetical protein
MSRCAGYALVGSLFLAALTAVLPGKPVRSALSTTRAELSWRSASEGALHRSSSDVVDARICSRFAAAVAAERRSTAAGLVEIVCQPSG